MIERLNRLEKENRMLKWAGAGLLAVVVTALALQSATQQRIFIYADQPYVACGKETAGEEVALHNERRL